jgi:F-type H+-transporting ATPase subunit epsilon
VLPGHRPLFVGIGKGRLRYREGGGEESFAIRGGYAQIQPEKVVVMTEVGEDDDSGDAAA